MKPIKLKVFSIPDNEIETGEMVLGSYIVIIQHVILDDSVIVKGITETGERSVFTISKQLWDAIPEVEFSPKYKQGRPARTLNIHVACSNKECLGFLESDTLRFILNNNKYKNWSVRKTCDLCGYAIMLLNPPIMKEKQANV